MFTEWQQVENWINNNQLDKWIFTKNDRNSRSSEGGTPNDKIVDSEYLPGERDNKILLTKQMLEDCGIRVYGYGWQGKRATDGMFCEVQLAPVSRMPISVGQVQQPMIDKDALRKEILNEIKLQQYEDEKKQFEQEKKEFQKEKEGVIGLAIGYLRPVLGALARKNVAGVDAPDEVIAEPVAPLTSTQETKDFSPEEEDKVYTLMVRFKKCEPDYLRLLESVVTMAEAKDQTYTMAKSFLLKD